MKIKVNKKDCIFYVNEDEKTVTCVLTKIKPDPNHYGYNVSRAFTEFISDYIGLNVVFFANQKTYMKEKYIGIAKCSPEDDWDEEKGRRLAFARVKKSFYNDFFLSYRDYLNRIKSFYIDANNLKHEIINKVNENMIKLLGDDTTEI